jgi:hypothetical protein
MQLRPGVFAWQLSMKKKDKKALWEETAALHDMTLFRHLNPLNL